MKILIVRNSPTTININNYNVQEIGLAKALIKKGNQVSIVFYAKEYKEEVINGIKIYFIPGKKFLNYIIYEDKIYDIAKNYDMIQTSEYNQIMSYLLLKKFPTKTIIYHGPYFRKKMVTILNNKIFDMLFLKKYLKYNPTIICKSSLAMDFVQKKGFTNATVVGVGLDKSKFENAEEYPEIKNIIDKNCINLLSIGRVEKLKNTYFLLKVLKKLVKSNDKYRLLWIGKPIKKYKEKCLRYIKKNHIENYVTFLDNVPQNQLRSIYENVDLFLLPSTSEIFGMVLLESIYFHVPILSSYNGGASVLLEDANIIREYDVDLWANKIENIKQVSYKDKKIEWDDIVNCFIEKYNEVLKNGKTKKE